MDLRDMIGTKEKKKDSDDKMTREKAFKIIEEWVEKSRSRVYGESLLELQNMLWVAVMDERLTLDAEVKRKFNYVLEEPIRSKDGKEVLINMINITPQTMNKVFEMETLKTNEGKTNKMLQNYCRDSEGNELMEGHLLRIDPRDSLVIQAVINAFFF